MDEERLPTVALIGPEAERARWRTDLAGCARIILDTDVVNGSNYPNIEKAKIRITDRFGCVSFGHGGKIIIRDEPAEDLPIDVWLPRYYLPRELIVAVKLLSRAVAGECYRDVLLPLVDELLTEARTDSITGLLSRNGWKNWTSALEADRFPMCIAFLDLDNFKDCNAAVNWTFGDEVLKSVGQLLQQALSDGDVAARWGGDEFALLFAHADSAEVRPRIEQLCARISTIRFVKHPATELSASVGCAMLTSAEQFDTAFAACQQALREAKARGGNCAVFAEIPGGN
jgi:diguanylate cyclase (GGDEF)-like protein